jgi:alkylation response protein AidB-like acyl-CoA dehydrogenase
VIDEELRRAGVRRPHLQVAAWALPTLIEHGTPEQQERWMGPSLRQELLWCQLFSEPEAGSDLASLRTRAERTDGGWLLTGQKVWTSMAHQAHWGICLARTSPDKPPHEGITCFFVDMSSPGIDIRPLRELTGEAWFNEVFLDEVFVPDDCVIGAVDDGWRVGRTTLANERVSMGSGASIGAGVQALLGLLGDAPSPLTVDRVGALLAADHALGALRTRTTLRALTGGASAGPEASVLKLLGVLHDQDVQEVGVELLGPAAAAADGEAAGWVRSFLWNRCLSIAGGTSEIQRNVIAERILGLPRDP